MGAITDWAVYARQVTQSVHLPPPKADDPPVDLNNIKSDYEANNGEMEKTRHEIENLGDNDPKYLEKLNHYEDLVKKQTELLAKLEKLKEQGPPEGMDKGEFDKQVKDLEQKLGASIHGDQDGQADGGHDLGQGRYLTRIGDSDGNDESGSMFGTAHKLLGDGADETRTANLNRNKYDPNSADGNMNSGGRATGPDGKPLRDADLVNDGDFVVIGVKPEAVDQAKQNGAIPTVDPDVKAHADQVKQNHVNDPNYADYSNGMDDLLSRLSAANPPLTPEQQKEEVDRYDRMVKTLPGVPLSPEAIKQNEENLRKLLASPGFNNLPPEVKTRAEELYKQYGDSKDTAQLAKLNKLLSNKDFQSMPADKQKEIMQKYGNDKDFPGFTKTVDDIIADDKIGPGKKTGALDYARAATNRRDYKDNPKDRQTIMENVSYMVRSDDFQKATPEMQQKMMDYLFEDDRLNAGAHSEHSYARDKDGGKTALKEGPGEDWDR